jgi:uncharacterized protein GlcG (DUF336 family)
MNDHALDVTVISLAGARAIIDAARREAEVRGVRVSIAVLDRGGHLVAFDRMDDIHPGTVAVATGKARTALLYNRPTQVLAAGVAANMALLNLPDMMALPGGIPLPGKSGASGAVGVSGAAPEVDEAIAKTGVDALNKN